MFAPRGLPAAGHIMRREKLPGRSYYAAKPLKGGGGKKKKKSQGRGPERYVRVLFRMFFQLQNRLRCRLQHKRLSMHHFLQPSQAE